MNRIATRQNIEIKPVMTPEDIIRLWKLIDQIYIDEKLQDAIANFKVDDMSKFDTIRVKVEYIEAK